ETLARALHHVHQHGIIHRNLKPNVVLLDRLGIPKVSSFDLARLPHAARDEGEEPGQLIGTPAYMAPEQAGGAVEDIGPATDVHALGLILYEMLTGRPPFEGATPVELLKQVQEQELAPRQVRPDVPRDLDALCRKCLCKDPAGR